MAASDCDTILPSFCSRMANVDASRAKAEYWGTAVGCACLSRVRAVRRAEWRATENMVGDCGATPREEKNRRDWEIEEMAWLNSRENNPKGAEKYDLGLARLVIRR